MQGPPGTGKTYTGAWQILELVGQGKRVGVTATSHAVICNLLTETADRAREAGVRLSIGQKPGEEDAYICTAAKDAGLVIKDNGELRNRLAAGEMDVVGGTTWVWTRPDFERSVDVLVVDEAGQMCMADILASARAADSLILLGDPMQLAQPSQGAHPPGSAVSALEHILGQAKTMPDDLGLFMERTRRMHPDITQFTSEVFYEDRLGGIPGLERQTVLGDGYLTGSGLRFVGVEHQGNANSSPEEAEEIVGIVRDLVRRQWRDRADRVHPIDSDNVLVLTPFNAQIREIREAFERRGEQAPKVGTVDKFQGRQAPAVVYSMASSSAEDAPRGLEFLYDLHRLNVATSRAQCLAVIVGNPELVRVYARTPHQMRLVNALCRFFERSGERPPAK